MRGWSTDDIKGKPCARLNRHLLPAETDLDSGTSAHDLEVGAAERNLQRKCEHYLEHNGFKRMTAANAGAVASGWFGHMHKAQGNPFTPDLWIIPEPNDRPALLIELKTRDVFQPGQKEMIARDAWTLCRSFAEFVHTFEQWNQPHQGA